MKALGVPQWGAVGVLESLWHITAEFAYEGNIGRFPDDEIAELMGWKGEPRQLIAALTIAGWLDECKVHRLVVHDWGLHADRAVKKRAGENGVKLLCRGQIAGAHGCAPGVLVRAHGCAPPVPEPEPEPEPVPEPDPVTGTPDAISLSLPPGLDSPPLRAAWGRWLAYEAEGVAAGRMTATGVQSGLAMFRKFASWGDDRAIAAIDLSIERKWLHVHEDFDNQNGHAPPPPDTSIDAEVARLNTLSTRGRK